MKQVIILRKDLNMRKGKMVAQGSHASLKAFLLASNAQQNIWLDNQQTKICVGVEGEWELHSLYAEAHNAGLPCALILDAGLTEFKEPTYTALGIGPADIREIDKITGHLRLL